MPSLSKSCCFMNVSASLGRLGSWEMFFSTTLISELICVVQSCRRSTWSDRLARKVR